MGKRKSLKSSSPLPPSSPEHEANGEPQESSQEEEDQPNGNSSSSPSEDSESGSEPSSDSDSDESSGPSEDMVNVDFEFFDPRVSDFHGVKTLLRTFLDDEVWDISGFVELVLAQTTVGSVIKAGEEEDPIGVISALNLARYQVPLFFPIFILNLTLAPFSILIVPFKTHILNLDCKHKGCIFSLFKLKHSDLAYILNPML
jgi:hypothetical protein